MGAFIGNEVEKDMIEEVKEVFKNYDLADLKLI